MAGIVLAHAAVLAALAVQRMQVPAPIGSGPRLVTFDLAKAEAPLPRATPKPKAPVIPAPIVPTPQPPPIAISYPQMDEAQSAALVAGGCDLTEPVRQALRSDDRARSAILGLPADVRSVANAVMLWDRRWVAVGASDGVQRALATIRASILATIASAPEQCRTQDQTGPRLIGIPGPPDVTLALGSGHWRWGDLAPEADQHIATASNTQTFFDLPTSTGRSGT